MQIVATALTTRDLLRTLLRFIWLLWLFFVRWQRGAVRILPTLLQQSIDISCSPGPQQQTCSSGVRWSDGTDRQTDRQTDARQLRRPCYAYYAGSVNNWSFFSWWNLLSPEFGTKFQREVSPLCFWRCPDFLATHCLVLIASVINFQLLSDTPCRFLNLCLSFLFMPSSRSECPCSGTVSVRPSVYPIDPQQQQRAAR